MQILTRAKSVAAFTLLEMALVVGLILGLIAITFVGSTAYRRGANKARCVMNQANVQKAVRSWAELNGRNVGQPCAFATAILPDYFNNQAPTCPGNGTYTPMGTVPDVGIVYFRCSLGTYPGSGDGSNLDSQDHTPGAFATW